MEGESYSRDLYNIIAETLSRVLLVACLETLLSSFALPDYGIIPPRSPCRLRGTSDL